MNDSARVIRAVCKYNPNDGIYDSLNPEPVSGLPTLLHLVADGSKQPTVEHEPIKEVKAVNTPLLTCASCFVNITEGHFVLTAKQKLLLFCQRCSEKPPQTNFWKIVALFLVGFLVQVFIRR